MSVSSTMCSRPSARVSAPKLGCNTSAFGAARVGGARGERGSLLIMNAATKAKKTRDLSMLKGMLENDDTMLVAGFRYEGLSVRALLRAAVGRGVIAGGLKGIMGQ